MTLKEVMRKERLFFVAMNVGIVVEAVVVVVAAIVAMDVGIVVVAAVIVMDVVVEHVVIEVTFYSMAVSWHSKLEVFQCSTPNIIRHFN